MADDPRTYEEIGGMRADIKNLCRSVDNMRIDMKTQHDTLSGRITEIERDRDMRKGANARGTLIRGIILTVFGGAVGSALITYFTHGGK